ncbi:MAG: hypothetical protein H6613_04910 [Ignavibacteriales bacterium]|nr:hypothetical protein [Ignavibacteriales bacterium]
MSSIDDLYFLKDEDNEVYSISEKKKEYLIKMVDKLPVRNSLDINIILFR